MADKIRSPFSSPLVSKPLNVKGDADDVYDHNSCPYFNHPHSMSKETIPVVFEEGELGKQYHGKTSAHAASISTPMSDQKKGE